MKVFSQAKLSFSSSLFRVSLCQKKKRSKFLKILVKNENRKLKLLVFKICMIERMQWIFLIFIPWVLACAIIVSF